MGWHGIRPAAGAAHASTSWQPGAMICARRRAAAPLHVPHSHTSSAATVVDTFRQKFPSRSPTASWKEAVSSLRPRITVPIAPSAGARVAGMRQMAAAVHGRALRAAAARLPSRPPPTAAPVSCHAASCFSTLSRKRARRPLARLRPASSAGRAHTGWCRYEVRSAWFGGGPARCSGASSRPAWPRTAERAQRDLHVARRTGRQPQVHNLDHVAAGGGRRA